MEGKSSDLQFILTSATVGNPIDCASKLIDRPVKPPPGFFDETSSVNSPATFADGPQQTPDMHYPQQQHYDAPHVTVTHPQDSGGYSIPEDSISDTQGMSSQLDITATPTTQDVTLLLQSQQQQNVSTNTSENQQNAAADGTTATSMEFDISEEEMLAAYEEAISDLPTQDDHPAHTHAHFGRASRYLTPPQSPYRSSGKGGSYSEPASPQRSHQHSWGTYTPPSHPATPQYMHTPPPSPYRFESPRTPQGVVYSYTLSPMATPVRDKVSFFLFRFLFSLFVLRFSFLHFLVFIYYQEIEEDKNMRGICWVKESGAATPERTIVTLHPLDEHYSLIKVARVAANIITSWMTMRWRSVV